MDDKHLIIDGFNVIFAVPKLVSLFRKSESSAKFELEKLVQLIHDVDLWMVTLVYDGKGSKLDIQHPFAQQTFTVVHCPSDRSADAVIERMITKSHHPDRITVVTNDHLIRDAAHASGAVYQSVEALLDWSESCSKKNASLNRTRKSSIDQDWGNRIPL
ncbi:MAG: NYN domain-containing protein [Opitutales bacterium]|nr:NYN domain-containing protein [Opitutales bacterium]